VLTYVSFPVVETVADFMREVYDKSIRSDPGECFYAVIDKTHANGGERSTGKYAGIIALSATSTTNTSTELGALIFPDFHRTHVASNAIGLLLLWTLDPPSRGGLGLRRVEWKCHAENLASRRVAERMTFEFEGIARWQRVFPGGKVSLRIDELERRSGTTGEKPGRHTAMYSIVWDEWDDDKRAKVVAQMERTR